jgi:hypothetical protein
VQPQSGAGAPVARVRQRASGRSRHPATAKTSATAPAAKQATATRSASRAAAASLDGVRGTFAQLEQVKKDLEAVSVKLNGIDPDTLSAADRPIWEREVDRVDLAIARARNALQHQIIDAFEGEIGGIADATAKLAASLARLNQVAQVIEAVAGVLGVIEKVILLAR